MRTFDEIQADVRRANAAKDAASLRGYAAELQALDAPQAMASALTALGTAEMLTGNYPLSLEHYGHALALYEHLGDSAGVARVTANIGRAHANSGNNPSALEYYRRAVAVLEELGDRVGVARIYGDIGSVHANTDNYPSAMEYFRRALAVLEALSDRTHAAHVNSNLGIVYVQSGDYPSALENLRRALAVYEEQDNLPAIARATDNIGIVYFNTGDHPSALEHYRRALAILEELGDRANVARVTGNMGTVYAQLEDHSSALNHFRSAMELYEEIGHHAEAAYVNLNMISSLIELKRYNEAAELLERQAAIPMDRPGVRALYESNCAIIAEYRDDLDTAQRHLLSALAICIETGMRAQSADYHRMLRDLAQKRNDFAGFIEHNAEFLRITEDIRGKEATQRLTMMEAERKMEGERREREKERAVLYSTLPKHVADRVIRGEDVSGDHFDNAAVMFIDIVGFTSNTSHMPPNDVVKMLENIFSTIDGICDTHNVIKIKTIGDSYMCFRGDADAHTNALCIMHVALEAMKRAFTWPNGDPIQFRVGIHIGPATAGVIGTQRLQYDVWGDTVNVASRMESTGEPGRIHVSEAFATSLGLRPRNDSSSLPHSVRNDSSSVVEKEQRAVIPSVSEEPGTWYLALRGETEIKGKGTMTTYWLEKV